MYIWLLINLFLISILQEYNKPNPKNKRGIILHISRNSK